MDDRAGVIGVGVIGAGTMGHSHVASLADDPRTRLCGVAGIPKETARDLARQYGATQATDDYRELLDDPEIALVTVATPDDQHHEICQAALAAGKHVFVEKPLTTSLSDADELVAAADQSASILMVCFNHRWLPPYARAKDEIAAGRIGTPRMAYARKNDRIFVPTEMLSWAAEPPVPGSCPVTTSTW